MNGSPEKREAAATTEPGPPASTDSSSHEMSSVPEDVPGLPRLNYNLLEHKWKLAMVTFLLVLESSILPIGLFYGLWFGTTLRHGILFAIVTAFFGLVTGIEFGLRSLKLIMKKDTYRPPGSGRWHFDFSHWTLTSGYTIMTAILIGASVPHEPLVRPLAIPVPLFFIQVGSELVIAGVMNSLGKKAPFRMSSVPKGERVPPLVLTIVEDVVAVDGTAGKLYRKRLMDRYDASWRFRAIIRTMNWFWGIGALLNGIGTMIVIWTVPQEVAYGVGWGSPLVFVVVWVLITVHWVRMRLREEKRVWAEERR